MPIMRKRKYYDVLLHGDEYIYYFESCGDAATWLFEEGKSKSIGAAKVGMSAVLTGKRSQYRYMTVSAKRYY